MGMTTATPPSADMLASEWAATSRLCSTPTFAQWRCKGMTRYIETRRGTFGIIYVVIGGKSHGRTLTLAEYDRLVDSGVPVVRHA